MRRALFLAVVGLGGAAILISLGLWQVQRLAWKQGLIADIEARIAAEPVALPAEPDPAHDAYLPVLVVGRFTGETHRVLVSQKLEGAGYRLISPFDLGSRRILVDRGFISASDPAAASAQSAGEARPDGEVSIAGNLQWPQEVDGFTPAPDMSDSLWYARDVPAMAAAMDTEPVLVVARSTSPADPAVTPLPVETSRIPNDHLQYAVTWFSLAALWLAMSLYFLRRRAHPSEG